MKVISPGEGQRFFPSFFHLHLLLALALLCLFFPFEAAAQRPGREKLSRYDRLAEEATLLNRRGQYDGVITRLEPYKGDKKNDSALFFNELGIAYRQKGRLSESIAAYREALARDPENPVIMNNLGYAFFLNKEHPKAIEQFQKVLRLNPHFKEAHSNLGLAYYQLQEYRKALEELEIVLKLDPQHKGAKKLRDEILKRLKEQK
jgi:Flp pilus assembly protein TadD